MRRASSEALALIRDIAPEMRAAHDRGDGHFSTEQVERAERLAVAPLPAPAGGERDRITYPSEMLPSPDEGQEADVFVQNDDGGFRKVYSTDAPTPQGEIESLVSRFARALLEKLKESEAKYGWQNAWARSDWADTLRKHVREHVEKGDPRDVAAYCAFAWHHGWSLSVSATSSLQGEIGQLVGWLLEAIAHEDDPDQELGLKRVRRALKRQCSDITQLARDNMSLREQSSRDAAHIERLSAERDYWEKHYNRLASDTRDVVRIERLEAALEPFAKIELPPHPEPGDWVARTLHCNNQVTAYSVLQARAALRKEGGG